MKKIVLASLLAAAACGGTMHAQEPAAPQSGQEENAAAPAVVQENIEVEISALPQPVRDALAAKAGYEAKKAFEAGTEEAKYYLVLFVDSEGNTLEVLYNANGEEQPK